MSVVEYQEPYRFVAGFLALVVHLLFLAFLYFGVHWQSQPLAEFSAEIWNSLPEEEQPEPPPHPPAKVETPPPARVVAPVLPPVRADIEMNEKKSKPIVALQPKKDDDHAKAAKARQEAQEKARAESQAQAEAKQLKDYENKQRALQQRLQAEQQRIKKENDEAAAAARDTQIATYQDRIRNKIRRRMMAVADVPANVEAIFTVTLLPDGSLLEDPVLQKGSGYPAYDDAAERAIILAQPLPIPTDPALQRQFRQLTLSIKPQESE